MPRTDGDITKDKILQVAEKLFAKYGFDGTGIDKIAKETGINKGSIYYHFKDKKDILISLFDKIIEDMEQSASDVAKPKDEEELEHHYIEKITREIKYLDNKKRVLAILLMETFKADNKFDYLFKCAEISAKKELDASFNSTNPATQLEIRKHLVYEFFTGMIPILSFIILKEKWCEYYSCSEETLFEDFNEAFQKSHLNSHKE